MLTNNLLILCFYFYIAQSLDTGRPEQAQRLKTYAPFRQSKSMKPLHAGRIGQGLRLYCNTYNI